MGHSNFPSSKQRNVRQWHLLDIITAAFFGALLLFFLVVFTPLGDSLAASCRQTLLRSTLALLTWWITCPVHPRINSQFSREMNYYRERHCPPAEATPLCLIPRPPGYRVPVQWPGSLHKIWHDNMPYNKIADRKGHQGWMKKEGPYFIFPGGGTMFPDGAVKYIEKLKLYVPIGGGTLRMVLDMGCGVGAFILFPISIYSYGLIIFFKLLEVILIVGC